MFYLFNLKGDNKKGYRNGVSKIFLILFLFVFIFNWGNK